MELLRQFDLDALENALAQMYLGGMKENEVAASLQAYLLGDDKGQPRWMSVVDGFYRHAAKAIEDGNLYERDFLLNEAWNILLSRNALM